MKINKDKIKNESLKMIEEHVLKMIEADQGKFTVESCVEIVLDVVEKYLNEASPNE